MLGVIPFRRKAIPAPEEKRWGVSVDTEFNSFREICDLMIDPTSHPNDPTSLCAGV